MPFASFHHLRLVVAPRAVSLLLRTNGNYARRHVQSATSIDTTQSDLDGEIIIQDLEIIIPLCSPLRIPRTQIFLVSYMPIATVPSCPIEPQPISLTFRNLLKFADGWDQEMCSPKSRSGPGLLGDLIFSSERSIVIFVPRSRTLSPFLAEMKS